MKKELQSDVTPCFNSGDPRGNRTPVTGVRVLQHHLDIPEFNELQSASDALDALNT